MYKRNDNFSFDAWWENRNVFVTAPNTTELVMCKRFSFIQWEKKMKDRFPITGIKLTYQTSLNWLVRKRVWSRVSNWTFRRNSVQSWQKSVTTNCLLTGPSSRGEITKNNKCGSIIKDDNFMITCADRSTWMAGLIKLPHILGFKFISPRLLGPVGQLFHLKFNGENHQLL